MSILCYSIVILFYSLLTYHNVCNAAAAKQTFVIMKTFKLTESLKNSVIILIAVKKQKRKKIFN